MAAKKPGKYDAVIDKLTPLPPENPSYQEKVDAYKKKLRDEIIFIPTSLAKAYEDLRTGAKGEVDEEFTNTLIDLLGDEGITALKSECDKRMLALEQMLAESQKSDEIGWGDYGVSENTIKLPHGTSISIQREPTGRVKNKEAFRLWCIAEGLENSLQLWPSTANAIVKDRCVKGLPEPDGIEIFSKTIVKMRKG